MQSKENVSGLPAPGEKNYANLFSSAPIKKVASHSPVRELNYGVCLAVGMAAAGQSVSEDDIFNKLSYRYRRRGCLSVLRETARRYPGKFKLYLNNGLWTLTAIAAEARP